MKNLPTTTKLTHEEIQYIVVDLFSGAGGTSTGIERAFIDGNKVAVVIAAVNHDPVAIASHALNHPFAIHFIEDIRNIAFWQLAALIKMNRSIYPNAKLVIWASAECTNYSKAKGGQPRNADSRTLPEALYEYVEYFRPDILQVENVVEFMSWGALDESGRPVSRLAGSDYLKWIEKIRGYGYEFSHRIMNAADYGGYTSRVRFFGQFVTENVPFVWPEATHAKHANKNMFSDLHKWLPVKDVLDLWDEGKTIFDRKKPLCEKTLERIYAGLLKFVAHGDESFISKYYSGQPEHKNISVNGPAGAITTKDGQAVVFISKYNSAASNGDLKHSITSVENPSPVIATQNRLAVVQAFMQQYHGNGIPVSIEGPATAITTKDRLALVTTQFIDQQYGTGKAASIESPAGTLTQVPKLNLVSTRWLLDTSFNNKGVGIDEPAPTILACRKHHYLVNPQYKSAGSSIEKPCFTLIAKMDKRPPSIVTAESGESVIVFYEEDSTWMKRIKVFMAEYGIVDIKMRMLKIPEMLRIMGFGDDYKLAGTETDKKKFIGNAVHTIIPQRWYESMAINNMLKKEAV